MSIRNYQYFFVLLLLSFAQLANCAGFGNRFNGWKKGLRPNLTQVNIQNVYNRVKTVNKGAEQAAAAAAPGAASGAAANMAAAGNLAAGTSAMLTAGALGVGVYYLGKPAATIVATVADAVNDHGGDIANKGLDLAGARVTQLHAQAKVLQMVSHVDPEAITSVLETLSGVDPRAVSESLFAQANRNNARAEEGRVRASGLEGLIDGQRQVSVAQARLLEAQAEQASAEARRAEAQANAESQRASESGAIAQANVALTQAQTRKVNAQARILEAAPYVVVAAAAGAGAEIMSKVVGRG